MYDNGVDAEERVIVFATDDNLHRLCQAHTWHMDGNFAMAPQLFSQLYVILAKRDELTLPVAYALLQRKSQLTYETLLTAIVDRCTTLGIVADPERIVLDFEMSAMSAVTAVFGNGVSIHGCFFHLCQSTFRKVQELGLVNNYNTDAAFSMLYSQCSYLIIHITF